MISNLMNIGQFLSVLEIHIWHAFIQGTLALLLAFGICRLFSRISPHISSWMWRFCYIKLIVAFLFLGSICLPVLRDFNHVSTVTSQNDFAVVNQMPNEPSPAASISTPVRKDTGANTTTPAPVEKPNVLHILTLIWSAGVVFFMFRTAVAWHGTQVLRRTCRCLEDEAWQSELAELCHKMRIRRIPKLMVADVKGPLICGLISPSIILSNRTLAECSRLNMRLTLAHELAHVKRHDLLWAWLPILGQWFFFFNPVVWLAYKEWLFAQEAACDSLAIQLTSVSREAYGRMILSHVMEANAGRQFMAVGIVEPYEMLKRRLNAMKTFGTITRKKQFALGFTIGMLGVLGIIPWALGAKQDKVPNTTIARYCANMEQNYKAIKDVSMTVDWTQTDSSGSRRQIAKIRWIPPKVFSGNMRNAPVGGGPTKIDLETHSIFTDGKIVKTLYTHGPTNLNNHGLIRRTSGAGTDLGIFSPVNPALAVWGGNGIFKWDSIQKNLGHLVWAKQETRFGAKGLGLFFQFKQGTSSGTQYVWIDESHGYMPRIIEDKTTLDKGQGPSQRVQVNSVQKRGDVWFPQSVSVEISIPAAFKGTVTLKSVVSDLCINSGINPKTLALKFPPGTLVKDEISKKRYTVK